MEPQAEPVRTVVVAPLTAREEGWNVIRAAAVIVCAAWVYIANTGPGANGREAAGAGAGAGVDGTTTGTAGSAGTPGTAAAPGTSGTAAAAGRDLMPYQKLFAALDAAGQRRFRELREGLLEAENARGASGSWPAAVALAAQGVPPFAPGPLDARDRYTWRLLRDGLVVNYLGLPGAAGGGRRMAAYLLWIQEPDPLAPPDPTPDDETHHRLPDGRVLHASIWTREAAGGDIGRAVPMPMNEGWTQLVAGGGQP